jgi:transposase
MPKQFPIEFRQRALRLLAEARQQEQYETEWAAIQATAWRLGVNSETLRKWLRRSEVDAGTGRVSPARSRRRSVG